jgi:hypothetical protein
MHDLFYVCSMSESNGICKSEGVVRRFKTAQCMFMFHVIVPTSFFLKIVRHVCLRPGAKENIRSVGNLEELTVKFVLCRSINPLNPELNPIC